MIAFSLSCAILSALLCASLSALRNLEPLRIKRYWWCQAWSWKTCGGAYRTQEYAKVKVVWSAATQMGWAFEGSVDAQACTLHYDIAWEEMREISYHNTHATKRLQAVYSYTQLGLVDSPNCATYSGTPEDPYHMTFHYPKFRDWVKLRRCWSRRRTGLRFPPQL